MGKKCYQMGVDARVYPPEKQSMILMRVKEWLETIKDEMVNKISLRVEYLKAKLQDKLEKLKEISMGLPVEFHRTNFRIGVFYTVPFLVLILAETYLNIWILKPYKLRFEGPLISLVITIVGSIGVHFLLNHLKENNPRLYTKIKRLFIIASVIFLIISIPFLAQIRAERTKAQQVQTGETSENLEERVKQGEGFFEKTSMSLMIAMFCIGISMCLVAGLILNEIVPRLFVSGRVLKLQKEIDRIRDEIVFLTEEREGWLQIVRIGIVQYNFGLNAGDIVGKKFWLSHLSIFFVVLMAGFLSTGPLYASEKRSVIIYVDITGSTSVSNPYSKMTDFEKNIRAVPEIIKKMETNTHLRIYGIHEETFAKPYLILEEFLVKDEGSFGERLARQKLEIIEKFKKLELEPSAKESDIIGAFFLSSAIFENESEETRKRIYFLSDFQNSVGINLEKLEYIDEGIIEQFQREKLIPKLDQVQIWACGVSPGGRGIRFYRSLEVFWRNFIILTGAELVCFSIERNFDRE